MPSETRNCQNCKKDFIIEPEDFLFYERLNVNIPNFCHKCRLQRKLTWRNERTLYKRECSLCKKILISVFPPEKSFPVYCHSCYHGTNWNPLSYGLDLDLSKSFLGQFYELQKKVPRQYALVFDNVNCEYTNGVGFSKNCYLVFVSDYNEDCFYSYNIYYCRNCSDLVNCYNCELCYDSLNCVNCQKVLYSIDCKDSYDVLYSKDCIGCNNLVGCVGLRKKSYCIFNQQYSKEEYEKLIKQINLDSHTNLLEVKKKFLDLLKKYPSKYIHGVNNYSVTGDNVSNSKNSSHIFSSKEMEDCKYIINGNTSKDCYECYVCVDKSELCFDSLGCFSTRSTIASHLPWSSYDLNYCDGCEVSSSLFGCVSLKNNKHCILNKQYSESEFKELKEKIIKNMKEIPYVDKMGRKYYYGDFFPSELSPYSYNETIATFYYPLTKEEALGNGYTWRDQDPRDYNITILNKDIPDKIGYVNDSIINEVIECGNNGKNVNQCSTAFKINLDEFQLYKKLNVPLPKYCHNCRYYERLKLENPRGLWHRKCMKEGCTNEFETSYAPDRPEIIYCEKCYQQEVY